MTKWFRQFAGIFGNKNVREELRGYWFWNIPARAVLVRYPASDRNLGGKKAWYIQVPEEHAEGVNSKLIPEMHVLDRPLPGEVLRIIEK